VGHVYGQAVLSLRTVERWLARFAAGDETLEDLPKSGRPRSDSNIALITQLLTDDPYFSQKMIATILSISPTTVKKILLEDLSLRKINFKWIPHRLSDDQQQERVRLSTELLQFLEARGPRKMTNVFTRDETWIRYDNPHSAMWMGMDVERPTRIRRSIGAKKLMIWVCFSRCGIGSVTALPEKESFTRQFFVDKVIEDFDKELADTRPKKRARDIFLHLDNEPTPRGDDDFNRLGIRRLPHPPYSPDLAPCDFWLFGNLKTKLEGSTFTSAGQLIGKVNEIHMDIPLHEFISVFNKWKRRLVECIDTGGNYL
jgi:histone-lysine N-methyltransferase SETMAR